MLVLTRSIREPLAANNCLVFDLGGLRVKLWLTPADRAGRCKVLIDAPREVEVHRGEHLPAEDVTQ